MLAEFSEKQDIPYRLLSDIDSETIRRYGILNDQVGREDVFLEGIPYPGVYVTDEEGVVVAKFFHDTYKVRDSPEMLIDAALGRITVSQDVPSAQIEDDEVRVSAFVHGGGGTIRQGIRRQMIVRFDLGDGIHIYGEPVPEGMIPTTLALSGPAGLVFEDPIYPETKTLRLESVDMELPVWSGTVDVVVPFYAVGELVSETRPLDMEGVEIQVELAYQACNDVSCFPPQRETLTVEVALDVIDIPRLGMHMGHGQREGHFDGMPHMRRLFLRKLRKYPLGGPRLVLKTLRLELAAAWRRIRQAI